MRIAIDNADAVVEALPGADPELIAYAKASGKPFLECQPEETRAAAIADFYTTL